MKTQIKDIAAGYSECLYWLNDDGIETGMSDAVLSENAKNKIAEDIKKFIVSCEEQDIDLNDVDLTNDLIGHNLYLTRNGHGTGFWDRDLGSVGEKLTEISEQMGTQDVYLSDDNELEVQ